MNEEQQALLFQWFESIANREGFDNCFFKDMDEAVVGKALVWRGNKWRWVPVYESEIMMDIISEQNPEEDPWDALQEYCDIFKGPHTPIINFGAIKEPLIETEQDKYDDDNYEDTGDTEEE